MNRDDARSYFEPLTIHDVTENDFKKLISITERTLGNWNECVLNDRIIFGHDNRYHMSLDFSKYTGTRWVTDKRRKQPFKWAHIMVLCDNYSLREGISLHNNGFIGFAGWADNDNVKPFIEAFKDFVDWKKNNVKTPKEEAASKSTF